MLLAGAMLSTTAGLPSSDAAAEETIRAVLSAKLDILDPLATTSYATRSFAYMVFDTLVSVDPAGNYHPQMLEKWEVSEDAMLYTFTLRSGLMFHDGTPVTAEDAVASLKRWGEVDAFGKLLVAATKEMRATGDDTFEIELAEPFGLVIEAIGKPSSNVPVIMPARIAANTPATEKVTEIVGSGPFKFVAEEWVPGSTTVFVKFEEYVPRDEPANGLAGGKVVKVDRVEFVDLPDAVTQVAALQAGEIDYVQRTPIDFIEVLLADPDIVVQNIPGIGQTLGAVVINHLTHPFDDINARRALQALMMQDQFMAGMGVGDGFYVEDCISMFMCGTGYASDAGAEFLPTPGIEAAKEWLGKSDYNGEPVRLLLATTVHAINSEGLVLEGLMKQAGFNVEVKAADWPTVAQERWNKTPTEEGGWNVLPIIWSGYDMASPLTNYTIANNCGDGYAGWACSEEITRLLDAFVQEPDAEKRKEIVANIQSEAHKNAQFLVTGQFTSAATYRADLVGFPEVVMPLFWGVERTQ